MVKANDDLLHEQTETHRIVADTVTVICTSCMSNNNSDRHDIQIEVEALKDVNDENAHKINFSLVGNWEFAEFLRCMVILADAKVI